MKLSHWGRATHICVGKLTTIRSDNGLSPGRRQAIIWTIAGIWLIGPLETNFSEILIRIQTFSFKRRHFENVVCEMAPICLSHNVLNQVIVWYILQNNFDIHNNAAPLENLFLSCVIQNWIQENSQENVVCSMLAIMFRPQCVNKNSCLSTKRYDKNVIRFPVENLQSMEVYWSARGLPALRQIFQWTAAYFRERFIQTHILSFQKINVCLFGMIRKNR